MEIHEALLTSVEMNTWRGSDSSLKVPHLLVCLAFMLAKKRNAPCLWFTAEEDTAALQGSFGSESSRFKRAVLLEGVSRDGTYPTTPVFILGLPF